MARTSKKGIDYFSHDVDMMQDRRIKLINAKHGLVGYAVYLRLLEELYREDGYFLSIDEDFKLLFAYENGIDVNILTEIVDSLVSGGLFDKRIFDKHSVITSKRIQRNYFDATERRKEINLIGDYIVGENVDYVTNLKQNVYINRLNADIGTQSKVKEKKEEEKEKKVIIPFEDFYKLYPKKKGKADAEKVWLKMEVVEELFIKICSSLEKQKISVDWKKENGQFIPHPATWLRGKRWDDEETIETGGDGWI